MIFQAWVLLLQPHASSLSINQCHAADLAVQFRQSRTQWVQVHRLCMNGWKRLKAAESISVFLCFFALPPLLSITLLCLADFFNIQSMSFNCIFQLSMAERKLYWPGQPQGYNSAVFYVSLVAVGCESWMEARSLTLGLRNQKSTTPALSPCKARRIKSSTKPTVPQLSPPRLQGKNAEKLAWHGNDPTSPVQIPAHPSIFQQIIGNSALLPQQMKVGNLRTGTTQFWDSRQRVHLRLGFWFTCTSGSLATRRVHLRLGFWFTCTSDSGSMLCNQGGMGGVRWSKNVHVTSRSSQVEDSCWRLLGSMLCIQGGMGGVGWGNNVHVTSRSSPGLCTLHSRGDGWGGVGQ